MDILQEFIICAAIWFDNGEKYEHQPKNINSGIVVSGRRHHNCYATLAAMGEKGIYFKKFDVGRRGQGFITSKDRFLTREESFLIAQQQGQIFHKMHEGKISEMLVSEDLY